jgi:hypothetical protein
LSSETSAEQAKKQSSFRCLHRWLHQLPEQWNERMHPGFSVTLRRSMLFVSAMWQLAHTCCTLQPSYFRHETGVCDSQFCAAWCCIKPFSYLLPIMLGCTLHCLQIDLSPYPNIVAYMQR